MCVWVSSPNMLMISNDTNDKRKYQGTKLVRMDRRIIIGLDREQVLFVHKSS